MYQSPDFVKVNMNVSDVYSEYETTTQSCHYGWFVGGTRTSMTTPGGCDHMIPTGTHTWVEANGYDPTLEACGSTNAMN